MVCVSEHRSPLGDPGKLEGMERHKGLQTKPHKRQNAAEHKKICLNLFCMFPKRQMPISWKLLLLFALVVSELTPTRKQLGKKAPVLQVIRGHVSLMVSGLNEHDWWVNERPRASAQTHLRAGQDRTGPMPSSLTPLSKLKSLFTKVPLHKSLRTPSAGLT